jgi:hypothetical protein
MASAQMGSALSRVAAVSVQLVAWHWAADVVLASYSTPSMALGTVTATKWASLGSQHTGNHTSASAPATVVADQSVFLFCCVLLLQLPSVDEITAHIAGNKQTTIIFFLDETFEEVCPTSAGVHSTSFTAELQHSLLDLTSQPAVRPACWCCLTP